MKKTKWITAFVPVLLWACLTLTAWLSPAKDISLAERRPLAQRPDISWQSLMNGRFMTDFEKFSLDQFPMRDTFRSIKALFHRYGLGQRDNNGIYVSGGYAAQQNYPLDEGSVSHALDRFEQIYVNYLEPNGSRVFLSVVPDKGYYLAAGSGQPAMDYAAMFSTLRQGMPWAEYIDLTGILGLEDYYRTDTHWRQEAILPAADAVCQAMGIPSPEGCTELVVKEDFLGVYYGQAALPMEPEPLVILQSPLLEGCTVYDYESGREMPVYHLQMLANRDPYDVYLSGARSLLTIHNPQGPEGKELIVFRDSFGSSLVPLLVQGYSKVTLVDIRYIQTGLLDRFVDFHGQDVLFLYSTLVLNNSETIK